MAVKGLKLTVEYIMGFSFIMLYVHRNHKTY